MIRIAAGCCALLIIGIPLLASPPRFVVMVAAAAAILCAAGVLLRWMPIVTAGAALALIEYTSVIWRDGRAPSALAAIGFGVALSLLLQFTSFAARFHGASTPAPIVLSQVLYWCRLSGIGAAVAVLVLLGATTLALLVRLPLAPLVAGGAALAVFAGAVGGLTKSGGAFRRSPR